ncbi:reduced coenzyme F420:NADP oxidoreductase [Microlunatus sagamiharensis]|uniref:Reduced coenzyme F420:NADP oxidoreductase n=1 Tax=Microlunatus sagamiharensis TaxID=546874 RepID=A0A1H2NFT4_9ACTN|nr:NADPH-dependent F420 reductase [Microlunatus sagamiharensis]SDV03686.1 reduced coenzyme F420:NADP oxidoreductase [Microlunatus sagamiharensis]
MKVGILGGTGPQGRGLGRRFAMAGHEVLLGSRDAARAQETAAGLAGAGRVTGVANADATDADVVVVAVPHEGHADLLTSLAGALEGKVVVDCVNPLGFDKQGPFPIEVADGSAAQEAQRILTGSTVVAAFHHVSAVLLDDPDVTDIPGDVLVLGEDREVVGRVIELAQSIPGARGVYAGRLRLARTVEAFTANLIAVNRRYKTHAGIAVTGLPAQDEA